MGTQKARLALRTAKKNNISDDKWEEVIRMFNDEK